MISFIIDFNEKTPLPRILSNSFFQTYCYIPHKMNKKFYCKEKKNFYINTFIYQPYVRSSFWMSDTNGLPLGREAPASVDNAQRALSLFLLYLYFLCMCVWERDSSLTMISGRHVSATTPPRGLFFSISNIHLCVYKRFFFLPSSSLFKEFMIFFSLCLFFF